MSDTAAHHPTSYRLDGDVAVIDFDDGKANVLTHAAIDALQADLSRAEAEARAVVITGRPGRFCAGFDLNEMTASDAGAQAMLRRGADLWLTTLMLDVPVVMAASGHALAAGAIWLLCGDVRIGEDVPAKIGLPEVAIGMPLPWFVVHLAEARMSRRHYPHVILGVTQPPAQARDAGYLDEIVAEGAAVERAMTLANEAATSLHRRSFQITRQRMRGALAERLTAAIDDDIASFTVAGEHR